MADLVVPSDFVGLPRLMASPDLPGLISAASQLVEGHCRRTFALQDYDEFYSGRNLARIWLNNLPVASVASVIIATLAIDNTSGDGWNFDPLTGELRRGNPNDDVRFQAPFPVGLNNVEVLYTAGFASVPDPVKRATIIVSKHLADGTRYTGLFESESLGDWEYKLADLGDDAMPPVARLLLSKFRLNPQV